MQQLGPSHVQPLRDYSITAMGTINQAFQEVKRGSFLPLSSRPLGGFDMPLSISFGQTNSQPTTVRMMLEWLDAKTGQKVLDVGSGSGWTTALLAHIVGKAGKVYAVERIPELVEFGRSNCRKLKILNAEFYAAGQGYGLPQHAPYERILVSASADEFPTELLDQLKVGGKLVVPVSSTIYEITKLPKGKIKTIEHPGFIFVPLIK